jgi:hypothetical protein
VFPINLCLIFYLACLCPCLSNDPNLSNVPHHSLCFCLFPFPGFLLLSLRALLTCISVYLFPSCLTRASSHLHVVVSPLPLVTCLLLASCFRLYVLPLACLSSFLIGPRPQSQPSLHFPCPPIHLPFSLCDVTPFLNPYLFACPFNCIHLLLFPLVLLHLLPLSDWQTPGKLPPSLLFAKPAGAVEECN